MVCERVSEALIKLPPFLGDAASARLLKHIHNIVLMYCGAVFGTFARRAKRAAQMRFISAEQSDMLTSNVLIMSLSLLLARCLIVVK